MQVAPPQSTPVSTPSTTSFEQLVEMPALHCPLLSQLPSAAHIWPRAQTMPMAEHCGPPQSTSVSRLSMSPLTEPPPRQRSTAVNATQVPAVQLPVPQSLPAVQSSPTTQRF